MQAPDQKTQESTHGDARPVDHVRAVQENWSRLRSLSEAMVEPAAIDGSLEQRALEAVKRLPQIASVVATYRAGLLHLDSLELAALDSYGDDLPRPVNHAHLLFCHRNALTDFVASFAKASESNAAIAEGLAQYKANPALPDPCLVAFSDQQYRLLYTAFAFGWVPSEDHPDLNQVFRLKGMEYLGKIACASGGPDAESDEQSPRKVWLEIRKRGPLVDLHTAAASDNKASLTEDVMQYLHIVQATAADGALDPVNDADNQLAAHASAIICDLIDEFS